MPQKVKKGYESKTIYTKFGPVTSVVPTKETMAKKLKKDQAKGKGKGNASKVGGVSRPMGMY